MDNDMSGMGALGVVLAVIIYFCVLGIPIMQVMHRAGYSRAWILIMFVPLLNIIFLWIFAFRRWPAEHPRPA
jgi:hypothetical protein